MKKSEIIFIIIVLIIIVYLVYEAYFKKTAENKTFFLKGPLPITEESAELLSRSCDDSRKVILTGAMTMGVFMDKKPFLTPPVCANMLRENIDLGRTANSIAPLMKYTKEQTDWIFAIYDQSHLKMVLVSVIVKPDTTGTPSVFVYAKKARYFLNVPPTADLTNPRVISNYFYDGGSGSPSDPSAPSGLITSMDGLGYGIRNLEYTITE